MLFVCVKRCNACKCVVSSVLCVVMRKMYWLWCVCVKYCVLVHVAMLKLYHCLVFQCSIRCQVVSSSSLLLICVATCHCCIDVVAVIVPFVAKRCRY